MRAGRPRSQEYGLGRTHAARSAAMTARIQNIHWSLPVAVSFFLSLVPVFCCLSPVSRLLPSPVTRLLSPVSCHPSPATCIISDLVPLSQSPPCPHLRVRRQFLP